jgi:hypothetical protein
VPALQVSLPLGEGNGKKIEAGLPFKEVQLRLDLQRQESKCPDNEKTSSRSYAEVIKLG